MVRRVEHHQYFDQTVYTRNDDLMDINYGTDKLIILNYPAYAGGKFISLCLALDPTVIHQDERLARAKIKGGMSNDKSFNISKTVLTKSQTSHFELGCFELAGFSSGNKKEEQAKLANDLWRELTHQTEFYFTMIDHRGGRWAHYPNARHIVFKDYDWILEARGKTPKKINEEILKKENMVYFDSSAVKDSTAFKDEIRKLFEDFGLQQPNWDHVEELRSIWMDTFTIGFNNNNKGEQDG
jgi:hypothetical protein